MPPSRRIPELDGIRGLAISMVMAYHFFVIPMPGYARTFLAYLKAAGRLSWSGVDLFFVLSGFLIGGILLDARDSGNYFKVFYVRRFFRIVPIYAAVLLIMFLSSRLTDRGIGERFAFMFQDRLPWFSLAFLVQNFWMAARNSLGGVWGIGGTWSLAIEEQFYLTLPLLIRVLSPVRLVWVLAAGVAAAPALRIFSYYLWPGHFLWFVMMPCRADALLMGVLAAIAVRNPRCRQWLKENRVVMSVALTILAAGFVVLSKIAPVFPTGGPSIFKLLSGGYTWLAFFYTGILLFAVIHTDSWIAWSLRRRWLMWLGSIAYGLYLWHNIVRGVLFGIFYGRDPENLEPRAMIATLLAIPLTLGLCWLSWRRFEEPLQSIGHRYRYDGGEFAHSDKLVFMWAQFMRWWRESRRSKCDWCGIDVPKGEDCCDREDCVEKWKTSRMGA